MKKVLVAALAVAFAVAMCVPASAFESQFGGYWRTRAYTNQDFSGADNEAQDLQQVDTRTRLYYTAKFSDDFKFVNKFEMDAVWGVGGKSYGDIGADGIAVEVKNSYVDFNIGNFNYKVGAQGAALGRSFIFDDDFSGLVISGEFGNVTVPFYWMKINEGGMGKDKNDDDTDAYVVAPVFKAGAIKVNPYLVYVTQDSSDLAAYDLGVDLDAAFDNMNAWFTGIYQGGDLDDNVSFKSYLFAFGAGLDVSGMDIHGQFFYASGDDNADDDHEAFADLTGGQSYYWAEIMGYGTFDDQVSNGSCADKISNIMAFNIGASMSPMEKLTVGADIWYASLVEDDAAGENYLGTELDLTASYKVVDNLTLDLIAAYLFAGDATGEEDPMEVGAQLSFSF